MDPRSSRRWNVLRVLLALMTLLTWMTMSAIETTQAAPSGQRLRTLAQNRSFYIGAAVNTSAFTNNEASYIDTLKGEYNVLVAENLMKFDAVHPERYRYDWTRSDQLVNFAETNGMKVRGHALAWHFQIPNWLTDGNFSSQEVKSILEDHVRTVVRRYKNRIWAWDVVNEAIADGGGYRTNSFWYQKLGPDYIKWAFQWAHEEDPNAILYYNDYGAEGLGSKSDSVYNLVRDLRNAGVPVEGVGWQLHETDGWRVSQGNRDNAARLKNLGVELSITELDLRIQLPATQAKLDSQAEGYRQAVEFCLSNCAALLTWGFTDKYSWVPNFFSGYGDALPFDSNYQPKPAITQCKARLAVVAVMSIRQKRTGLSRSTAAKRSTCVGRQLPTALVSSSGSTWAQQIRSGASSRSVADTIGYVRSTPINAWMSQALQPPTAHWLSSGVAMTETTSAGG